MTVFKRKIYQKMLDWKKRNGETALLIKGARRIGKSTIVRQFVENEYETYIFIDFSNAKKEVFDLFEDVSDLDYIFMRLQVIYKIQLIERKSAIVFDEVQKQPYARQAIKHLVADGRYDYLETGSLISIKKNVKDIILPSEESKLTMYPMDFEEFRWALGDTATVDLLRMFLEKMKPLGDAAHRQVMREFRLYMLVGGMPQAVSKYLETNNMAAVDITKREILALYEDDLIKLDDSGKSSAIFKAIPAQLSKGIARYQVTSVLPNETTYRTYENIYELADSMTVNVVFHSDDPNVGLALTKDTSRYKLFLGDTGLFVTQIFMDKDATDNVIYNKLLSDKLDTNLGYIYENMVSQIFRASGYELFYHTIKKNEGKSYYEVDFLLSKGNKLIPIEVKSSGYKSHTSLDRFCEKFSDRIGKKYLIYTKDLKKEGDIVYLPIYMAMFI
ncbi:MAG: AAA family ATPase [Bacteroidales bacterium]|nr:AAA family ATPase [Bacteroidales bacterium]